ncbi:MAG: cation:proton antiporter subunit C [Candidatus Thermoplasmatota archaeon]|nr:cation:proton antiporter subunit C [Candidatus Thermoplasmatota archaeon]
MSWESLLLMMPYITVVLLMVIGLFTVLFKKNLIKIIMGITIMQNGANLFLVSLAYRSGEYAPIFTSAESTDMVMPTPHALTLTSIVIGLATTALMLSFTIMIKRHYGSINTEDVRRCKE